MRPIHASLAGALIIGMILIAAVVSQAAAPTVINYQGHLTNAGGTAVPDGSYSIVFTIYDAASGGTSKWTETQSVTTSKGLFAVVLGTIDPITDTVFGDATRYLGAKVGGDPELAPRVQLVSVPYANRVSTIDGSSGGSVQGYILATDSASSRKLSAGSPTQAGFVQVFGGGSGGLTIDGNFGGGSGDPYVSLYGSGSSSYFNTNVTGDASVILPNDAIDAAEILDEPGIAQYHGFLIVTLDTIQMQDIGSVNITTPAAGYVVVQGECAISYGNTTGFNQAGFEIDTTAGGAPSFSLNPEIAGYGTSGSATTAFTLARVNISKTYFMPAGSHTVRLKGMKSRGGFSAPTATFSAAHPTVRATFFPTSYGTVLSVAQGNDVSAFSQALSIATGDTSVPGSGAGTSYQIDLRELELRAAKAQAESEKLQREVVEARIRQTHHQARQ